MPSIQGPLSLAISRAVAEADLRRLEMARTLNSDRVAELLASQAETARTSPLGSDQLLAIALDAAATQLRSPVLEALRQPADPLEQISLRREVYAYYDAPTGEVVSEAATDRLLRQVSGRMRHDPELLAGWLGSEARLNSALWDHPALPARLGFRGLMLACVATLREKASQVLNRKEPPESLPPTGVFAEGVPA